jgi:hypothetical protein
MLALNEDQWDKGHVRKTLLETVPNTSTVGLRVVGGYEKGTQCLGAIIGPPCS